MHAPGEDHVSDQGMWLTLYLGSIRLNMGAFFSISGMMTNLQVTPTRSHAGCRCMCLLNERDIHPDEFAVVSPDSAASNEDVL